MSRKAKEPRLYLDPRRRQWIIRDRSNFIRTGIAEAEWERANAELIKYHANKWQRSTGFIYFLTAAHPDYPIKIGFTEKMSSLRIRSLQVGCPYALYFLGHITGTMADERKIHNSFDHIRLHGEWFKSTPDLRNYISGICGKEGEAA